MEEIAMLVAQVEQLIERGDQNELADYLNELNISDVEELIDELPEHGPLFLETLSLRRAVNVFRILDFPTQERIFKSFLQLKFESFSTRCRPMTVPHFLVN